MALDESSVILQSDAAALLQKIAESTEGRQPAFDFIQNNVDAIIHGRYM
jgi:hypothetical protein